MKAWYGITAAGIGTGEIWTVIRLDTFCNKLILEEQE